MEKHKIAVLISVLALVAAWGMVPPVHGQGAPVFTISRLVMGTGVEDREPVGAAEVFSETVDKVYCFLEATEIAEDTEVSFIWFHGEKEMHSFRLPLKSGPRWRTYASKTLGGLKGEWRVEIRDASGTLVQEVKFRVE